MRRCPEYPQELEFYGIENGRVIDKKMNVLASTTAPKLPPTLAWPSTTTTIATGSPISPANLTDETRYNTPWIALQTGSGQRRHLHFAAVGPFGHCGRDRGHVGFTAVLPAENGMGRA